MSAYQMITVARLSRNDALEPRTLRAVMPGRAHDGEPSANPFALRLDAYLACLQRALRDAEDRDGRPTRDFTDLLIRHGRTAYRAVASLSEAASRWGELVSDRHLAEILCRLRAEGDEAVRRLEVSFAAFGVTSLRAEPTACWDAPLRLDLTSDDDRAVLSLARWGLGRVMAHAIELRTVAAAVGEHLVARLQHLTIEEALVTARLLAAMRPLLPDRAPRPLLHRERIEEVGLPAAANENGRT